MGALRQRLEGERRILVEDPHFQRQGVPEALAEALVGMGVGVDEAGDDDAPGGVDHAGIAPGDRLLGREIGADRRDPVAFDQDIGAIEMGPVRPGHHVAVADQDGAFSLWGTGIVHRFQETAAASHTTIGRRMHARHVPRLAGLLERSEGASQPFTR